MISKRDELQSEVVNKYLAVDPLKATLVLSTGFGKSKVVIDIIKAKNFDRVYILVNSTLLRDYSWKDEFIKFGMEEYFELNVTTVAYQTAYKWDPKNFYTDNCLFVADEVDFAADVGEYSKFFYNFSNCKILGVTGFITDNKKEWFNTHLPVFVEYTAAQAQEDEVLNKIRFTFIKFELSKNPKDLTVEYKKAGITKTFTQSENNAYAYAEKAFINALIAKEKVNIAYQNGEIDFDTMEKKLKSADYLIDCKIRERTDLLVNGIASAELAKKLITHLLNENQTNKVIIFSKRNAQSEKICGEDAVYNGTVDKNEAKIRFEKFNDGISRYLGVTDKINRGANIDNLNMGILESFFGSDTNATQRFGRLMRLKPDQVADFYIFLPYYIKEKEDSKLGKVYESKPTQQVAWAKSMLRSTKVKVSRVWDYRTIKTET